MEDTTHEHWLAELHLAERPRYFYGKLLTADDLQKEQDYWRRKNQLHNRFGLSQGVVCGLSVTPLTTTQGNGVRISAGLALDEWGREIVIPTDVDIVPLRLSDDCDPLSPSDDLLPPSVHISLCYRELAGGYLVVSAVEPEARAEQGRAGSLIEGYCLRVQEGAAPDVSTNSDPEVLERLRSGRLHDALCLLAAITCPPASTDPCVVLANVAVNHDGSLTVDACGPRVIVPTNRLLLQLGQIITRAATPNGDSG
jgi:hypothetical protein